MMSNELPAKSTPKGTTRSLSLEQHLVDTEEAAALLFSADYRIGRNFRRFFQISEEDHPRFLLHVRIAGLLHDLLQQGDWQRCAQRAARRKGAFEIIDTSKRADNCRCADARTLNTAHPIRNRP